MSENQMHLIRETQGAFCVVWKSNAKLKIYEDKHDFTVPVVPSWFIKGLWCAKPSMVVCT